MQDDQEIYAAVGGDAPFFELVDRFYEGVENDPALRAIYPSDLTLGKKHLSWFLIQRFGGPSYFNQERGHPRLRMRHMPFRIDRTARDSWVHHMLHAIHLVPVFAPFQPLLKTYFEDSATFMINHQGTS